MNKVFKMIVLMIERIIEKLTTIIGRILVAIQGAKVGRNVRFFGLPHVRISAMGNCTIGDSCSFRSSSTSNLIGINRPCILSVHNAACLEIGPGSGLSGTVIGAFSSIKLGKNVRCGANSLITDGDWHQDDLRSGEPRPIIIGDNVWLGVNVTVLKGVSIGQNTVIGAGSLVVKDIPANVIAAGNPCKVIREQSKNVETDVK